MKLLWGAHGFRAKEVLVEALRDEDAAVREAAAESCAEETGLLTIATKRDHASRPQPYLQIAVSPHPEVRGRALIEGRDSGCDTRIQEWLDRDEAARRAAENLRRSGGGLSRTMRSKRGENIAGSLLCVSDEDLPGFLRYCQRSLEDAGIWTGADEARTGDGDGSGLSLPSRASM